MQNGDIPDHAISSSNDGRPGYDAAYNARLNNTASWSADILGVEWIQIDLDKVHTVVGVVTQGGSEEGGTNEGCVSEFSVGYERLVPRPGAYPYLIIAEDYTTKVRP